MKAIILAAGRGKRMGALTLEKPKCMLELHGKPLIEWQMEAIKNSGITEIAIIKGYLAHTFFYNVHYFENSLWEETNMLYTLKCADEWLSSEECLVSYSDIVYTSDVIKKLSDTAGDIVISFDLHWQTLWEKRFSDPLSDAEIFNYTNNKLVDIGGRATQLSDIQGQYMGLLKFSTEGWKQIKEFIKSLSLDIFYKMDMTTLLKQMLKKGYSISVSPIQTPWCEIDNINDYHLCQKIMKPVLREQT